MKNLQILICLLATSAAALSGPVGYSDIIENHWPTATRADFQLVERDGVVTIDQWNVAKLGTKPTIAELEPFRAAAQTASDARDTQDGLSATERQQAKAMVEALRAGTGTQIERLQRVEKVCARLIEDIYK